MSVKNASLAEVLWELKRADKVSTHSAVAARAGFNPGKNAKTVLNVLEAVKQDWPHLQWWRVVNDDGTVEAGSEHAQLLEEWGAEIDSHVEDGKVSVLIDEARIMVWPVEEDLEESLTESADVT